ncbi:MAG: putative toxin-antitoxin system toxin component, PIN family [Acidobacteriota bacterium]
MLALRLVIDTNVLVSAALKSQSLQRTALTLAITRPASLYVSKPILDEYAEVLSRPELNIRKGLRAQFLQLIRSRAHVVTPSRRIEITNDPDDNIFIECAERARADFLITGNRKHFPAYWKSTKTVSPRDFVSLAAPHLLR